MKQWKQWPTDQCPVCKAPNMRETVEHLLQCNHSQPQSLIYQHIVQRMEELLDLITIGFQVQEFLMAMFQLPYCQKLSDHISQAVDLQYTLSPKWTAQGCISKQWKLLGPNQVNSQKRFSQWVPQLTNMFWQTAWEVWQQWNDMVHKAAIQGQNVLLYQEVQQEYQ